MCRINFNTMPYLHMYSGNLTLKCDQRRSQTPHSIATYNQECVAVSIGGEKYNRLRKNKKHQRFDLK